MLLIGRLIILRGGTGVHPLGRSTAETAQCLVRSRPAFPAPAHWPAPFVPLCGLRSTRISGRFFSPTFDLPAQPRAPSQLMILAVSPARPTAARLDGAAASGQSWVLSCQVLAANPGQGLGPPSWHASAASARPQPQRQPSFIQAAELDPARHAPPVQPWPSLS